MFLIIVFCFICFFFVLDLSVAANYYMKVLAVDQDDNYDVLIKHYLSRGGFDFDYMFYSDPIDALEDFDGGRAFDYDVLISDWDWGSDVGRDFGYNVRSFSDIPILYFTNKGASMIGDVVEDVGAESLDKSDSYGLSELVERLVRDYESGM